MTSQIYSHLVPDVKAGTGVVEITVDQTLGNGRLDLTGPDTVHVAIDGPQTVLLGDMIAGVYPAPGSEDSPDEFLAHIAINRRTLPWERVGPDLSTTSAVPWLALLVFSEVDLLTPTQRRTAPAVTVEKQAVQDIDDVATRNRLINQCGIPGSTEVDTLTVPNALLRTVMPTQVDLRLLCHVKHQQIDGVDVDHAIVVANRLPNSAAPEGERPPVHLAVLVSVEKAPGLFTLGSSGSTTLLVLHHWTFRPNQGGDFEQVVKSIAYRPHGGVQRFGNLPRSATSGETAPLSGGFAALLDDDGYFLTGVEQDQPVDANYRSPLRPFEPGPRSKGFAIAAAPNEFADAPPGAPLDFSHAAAFELGRLLALSDPAVLEDLGSVHATMRPLDLPALENPLPDALQKPDWVVNPEWAVQPWDGVLGQPLVKDDALFLGQDVADPTGVGDHLATWNVADIVSQLTAVGEVVTTPVTSLDIGSMTAATLEADFADLAQAGQG